MNLHVAVVATKSYLYAFDVLVRRVQMNARECGLVAGDCTFHLLVDQSADAVELRSRLADMLPGWTLALEVLAVPDGLENYQPGAQNLIAQLRQRVVERARAAGADFLWSLDSDVLPPPNGLRCSLTMLEFDGGYYDVACCPYPSQGGGPFLGGRGNYLSRIAKNVIVTERDVPERSMKVFKAASDELQAIENPHLTPEYEFKDRVARRDALVAKLRKWEKRFEKYPPKSDVFGLNAKGSWRQRGWMDYAYPGIGEGAVVPTDWFGMGATLMNREAMDLVDYAGYSGSGTEDLFIIWEKWWPRGIKLCVIPHCPADHVIRVKGRKKIVHLEAYHERLGQQQGHLRWRPVPFLSHIPGEQWDKEANDGVINNLTEEGLAMLKKLGVRYIEDVTDEATRLEIEQMGREELDAPLRGADAPSDVAGKLGGKIVKTDE